MSEVLQEAVVWVARMRTPDVSEQERRELIDWLKRSPVHVRHYLELVSQDVELSDASLYEGLAVERPAHGPLDNVLTLNKSDVTAGISPPERADARRQRQWWASAAAACALIAVTAVVIWMQPDRYHSAMGELRSIALDDGSTVTLNTQSDIQVRYTSAERVIELLRGEALFDVARAQDRPFRVRVDGVEVQALGTSFNIYRRQQGVVVTVMQGRVAVRPEGAEPKELGAGEQLDLSRSSRTRKLEAAEIAGVTTWTQRRVRFDQRPVSEVVAELNRYNREQLVIEDPGLAQRVITGTFEARDLDSFVLFLKTQAGASVREAADGTVHLTATQEGG